MIKKLILIALIFGGIILLGSYSFIDHSRVNDETQLEDKICYKFPQETDQLFKIFSNKQSLILNEGEFRE